MWEKTEFYGVVAQAAPVLSSHSAKSQNYKVKSNNQSSVKKQCSKTGIKPLKSKKSLETTYKNGEIK